MFWLSQYFLDARFGGKKGYSKPSRTLLFSIFTKTYQPVNLVRQKIRHDGLWR